MKIIKRLFCVYSDTFSAQYFQIIHETREPCIYLNFYQILLRIKKISLSVKRFCLDLNIDLLYHVKK